MSILAGLHGAAAAVLIASLLFVDELGVPLPFAPNEVLLLVAGLLIAGGALHPLLFFPLAIVAMTAGMISGFLWARAVGTERLRRLAARIGAAGHVERAAARIRSARPLDVAVARLLPGVRPYATLLAGAAGMDLRLFLLGALPAIVLWTGVFTLLGTLVGLPVERFLNRFERLGTSGALLALLAAGTVAVARRVPPAWVGEDPPVAAVPPRWRTALAIVLDAGVALTLAAAIDRVARSLVHQFHPSTVNEVLIVLGIVAVSYVAVSRRVSGRTAGERVFGTTYHRRRPRRASRPAAPGPGDVRAPQVPPGDGAARAAPPAATAESPPGRSLPDSVPR